MPDVNATLLLAQRYLDDGKLEKAIGLCRQILQADPTSAAAYYYLGNALQQSAHLEEAIAAFRMTLVLQPNSPEAHYNLGLAHSAQGQLQQAIEAYQQATKLRPLYAEAYNNLANCLQLSGRLDEAVAAFRRAVLIRPKSSDMHSNLGNALKDMGRLDDALACYDAAAKIQPDCALWTSHRLYTLHFHPAIEPDTLLQEHKRWNERFARPLAKLIRAHTNSRDPNRKLRIGYVSPDFREHVVGRNLLPLLREHDHQAFEIFCYSNLSHEDELTARFRSYADQWRDISRLDDDAAAEMIRADSIDILVDLSLHMGGNRLLLLARKPAPIQLTFAGYPSGTGLAAINYRLTDPYLDPQGVGDDHYVEKSIRLVDSFWCFEPLGNEPPVSQLPAIQNGFVTFGCLNNFCKVNEPVLRLWAAVLRHVPDSKLMLLAPRGSSREWLLDVLEPEGVDGSSIEFVDRRPRREYLELYHRIDIALDTFPYNGHTTTLEGLWMGVPVVTRVGRLAVSRAGFSQLSNLALPDLAANSDEQFVQIAALLAADRNRLSELRSTLRRRMQQSPLTDSSRFARAIEHVYRRIWGRWCQTLSQ